MNRFQLLFFIVLQIIISSFPDFLFGQSKLITSLNSKITPISLPVDDLDELNNFNQHLIAKNIIGLGEATHGTKEFFLYKSKLVRYLVTNQKFRTFVIEADFAGAQYVNDYISTGKGEAADCLSKMGMLTWQTAEFLELIKWFKEYNSKVPESEKVKFYGCDVQSPRKTIQYIKLNADNFTSSLSAESLRGLELINKSGFTSFSTEESKTIQNTLKELKDLKLKEGSNVDSPFFKRCIETIQQSIDVANAKDWYQRDIIRDRYMAQNCEWIYKNHSEKKMMVWAHNLHIAKDKTGNNKLPVGSYLKNTFGDSYYALGFGFNSGKLKSANMKQFIIHDIPDVSIKKSSDYVFKQCKYPDFLFDFKSALGEKEIFEFLNTKMHSRAIGGIYYPNKQAKGGRGSFQKLINMYDGIAFFITTNASTPISDINGKPLK